MNNVFFFSWQRSLWYHVENHLELDKLESRKNSQKVSEQFDEKTEADKLQNQILHLQLENQYETEETSWLKGFILRNVVEVCLISSMFGYVKEGSRGRHSDNDVKGA